MAFGNSVGPYGPKMLDQLNGLELLPDGTIRLFTPPTGSVLIDSGQLDVAGAVIASGPVIAGEVRTGAGPGHPNGTKVPVQVHGLWSGTIGSFTPGIATIIHGLVDGTGADAAPTSVQVTQRATGATPVCILHVVSADTFLINVMARTPAGSPVPSQAMAIYWSAYLDL